MFSKCIASGASLLLLSSLNSVQSLTMEGSPVTHANDLSCSECIRNGYIYDYKGSWRDPAMWNTDVDASNNKAKENNCFTADGAKTNPVGYTKSKFLSSEFPNKDYAVNACPYDVKNCGGPSAMSLNDVIGTGKTYNIDLDALQTGKRDSCGYQIYTMCGAPHVKYSITGATAK